MSIKIGTSGSPKNVVDVVVGTSSSAKKNVNKVVDWNNKIIWERTGTMDITGKLSFNTDPSSGDFYEWEYDTYTYEYRNKFLGISNVKYTGTSPVTPMTASRDYEVTYTGDTSGTITHEDYGSISNNAVAHIKGIGNFTGEVNVPYTITHENRKYYPPTPPPGPTYYTISTDASPSNGGTVAGGGSTFEYGDQCTLTATASQGYVFSKWSDNTTANPKGPFSVTGHASYTAYFTPITPVIPSITGMSPNGLTAHTAGTAAWPDRYSPCYENAANTIIKNGIKITFSEGNPVVWTPTNTYGISVKNVSPAGGYTITIVDGGDSGKYHTVHAISISATADGKTYSGSGSLNGWHLSTSTS